MAQRREVIKHLIDNLKLIDGTASSLLHGYIFKTDFRENVIKGFHSLEEVNDFPFLCVLAGQETRKYNTGSLIEGTMPILLTAYFYDEEYDNSSPIYDLIISDVEHIIYNLPEKPELKLEDIKLVSIRTDEGLLAPYGIVELQLSASYEVRL